MKHKLWSSLLLFALTLCSAALASSTWYVDGVNGSDNNNCKSTKTACKTIGHAISLASSGDSIRVAAATYTENLTIAFSLKIVGSGASTTIIDGGKVKRVVTINTGAHVALSKVTIQNGSEFYGGGIYNGGALTLSESTISLNSAALRGGGIYNGGTLAINHSTISRNSALSPGSFIVSGGGIGNFGGAVTINNSTVTGNSAETYYNGADGGGIGNFGGAVTINNSTITGNSAETYYNNASGGGIWGTATINNSTVSGNSVASQKGKVYGGGIYSFGGSAQNSIVANNSTGGNCYGGITSDGYNLSSDGSCNFNNIGDLNNTNPELGQLGDYGGPTQTIPLLSGSPAIDAGNPNGCTDGKGQLLKTDQRGKPRHDKEDSGGCDMGAYERQKD